MSLTLQVGKAYRTRSGKKREIIYKKGGRHVSIDPETLEMRVVTTEGIVINGGYQDPLDLTAEWTEKPMFDRALLPVWKAIAMDRNGDWWVYTEVPTQNEKDGVWLSRGGIPLNPDHYPTYVGPWQESLVVFEEVGE